MNKKQIIKALVETEKSSQAQESNVYTFWVDRKADKNQIKTRFEAVFGIKPEKVRTMIMPGKPKHIWQKNLKFWTRAKKKALIKISDDEKIDLSKLKQ